jgi:hypothetical protein
MKSKKFLAFRYAGTKKDTETPPEAGSTLPVFYFKEAVGCA